MIFPPIMRTATAYHYLPGGLLPRLFTLTPSRGAVILCYANVPHGTFPLGSMALCVARTFLLCARPKPHSPATSLETDLFFFSSLFLRHKGTHSPPFIAHKCGGYPERGVLSALLTTQRTTERCSGGCQKKLWDVDSSMTQSFLLPRM